jgi:rhamnogalacturonan endolyase
VTAKRIYTLMHDPTYRAQAAFENASYNQPPHAGFHIGAGMANPPVPSIFVK